MTLLEVKLWEKHKDKQSTNYHTNYRDALLHEKNVRQNIKKKHKNNRVATLSTLYLTVSSITIPSLKSVGQF